MGDAGSLFLGVLMAGVMVMFLRVGVVWCVASIVIFGLPILDTAVAFIRRGVNKRPLFVSDRGHIYDQMIDRGLPLRKTVKLCYAIAAVYALAGILISQLPIIYALTAAAGVFGVSGVVVWWKGFLEMDGLRGAMREEG
jgi:UDP-GlcNAc:undecaprenyl-phosphate GlcNAc-1-phosphate transferase